MRRLPINVECYAGGRAEERPRRVLVDDREYLVTEVLMSSLREEAGSRTRTLYQTVLTEDGTIIDIVNASDGQWYMTDIRERAQ